MFPIDRVDGQFVSWDMCWHNLNKNRLAYGYIYSLLNGLLHTNWGLECLTIWGPHLAWQTLSQVSQQKNQDLDRKKYMLEKFPFFVIFFIQFFCYLNMNLIVMRKIQLTKLPSLDLIRRRWLEEKLLIPCFSVEIGTLSLHNFQAWVPASAVWRI